MTCTHCQAETADGMYLCPRCIHDLRETIGQIGDALAVAEDTVGKLDKTRTDDMCSVGCSPFELVLRVLGNSHDTPWVLKRHGSTT